MPSVEYRCASCRRTYPLERPLWRCDCGSHLNLTSGPGLVRSDIRGERNSLWRYQAALPLTKPPRISFGEGRTPLIDGVWSGASVSFKLEFCSVSGSFKDRGIAVMVNYLDQCGIREVVEDSSGNGGAALATYSARAGFACRIFIPAATSSAKVTQIAASGAELVRIDGTREQVAEAAMREAGQRFYASHNWQALFVEGIKTLGYELWEDLGFSAPDNIVVPLGGGSNLIGCWLAFSELKRRGEIARMPRLFGIQAMNCSPLYLSFVEGDDRLRDMTSAPTIAEGIAVARPIRVRECLEAMRGSEGGCVAVTEKEIHNALADLAHQGLFVEPTSAVAAAGLRRLIEKGSITDGQRTILVLTGTGLKAAETIGRLGIASASIAK